MNFDILGVPFSRYGSFLAVSRRGDGKALPEGVYLRTVHGDSTLQEVFRIELLADGKPVAFEAKGSPAVLRLEAAQGHVELCFACPKSLRFLARGVSLRLTLTQLNPYGFAMPVDGGRWTVNSHAHRASYVLTPIKGKLVVDAPWDGMRCKRVVLDFHGVGRPGAAVEGAIEEFTSVVPCSCYTRSFQECVAEAAAEFTHWLNKGSLSVPERLAAAGELAAYVNWSAVVAPQGHLRRPTMFMSKNWMTSVFSWDHCFNAMALCRHNPQLAWDQLMVLFDHQDAHGALPDSCNDTAIVRNFLKPPIHGWALRQMMRRCDWINARKLKEIYPLLCRWTDWWLDNRDCDHDGIPHYAHGNDSGWDNATCFDIGTPLEGPDLSAFLIVQMDVLAEVAQRLGKKRDAHRWQKRGDQLTERLLAHNWKGDGFVAPRSGDHRVADGDSLVLLMPLVLGKRLPPEIAAKLVAAVSDESRFLSPHGLATENLKSKKYTADGYWRGPVWAPSTMLIIDGLAQLGEKQLAKEIARRFCHTVAASGMAENFDAQTGRGLRDQAYTWTSSVFQILAHDYLRSGA